MNLNIYSKDGRVVASVVVASTSYEFKQIMGENYLQLDFTHGSYVAIKKYAYVIYNNQKFTLIKTDVKVEKVSTCEYNYTARFEAPQELMKCCIMCHMAEEGQTSTKQYERNFSLAGTATEHLEMLLRTTDKWDLPFSIGSVDSSLTGVKVVGYNVVDCKSALQLIANAFECEWWVSGNETDGYTISLGKCSFDEGNPTKLAYGYNNGVLPNGSRQLHSESQRMTHICVQGGSKNINTLSQLTDADGNAVAPYGFATLHLPRTANMNSEGVGNIYYDVAHNKFDGETGFMMDTAVLLTIDRMANTMTSSLFDKTQDIAVEKAYDLSEFYPQATRKVTAFGFNTKKTAFYVEDSTIEAKCNYNIYQLGGEKITITFQTGALAGKEFEVVKYDHNNKRFECSLADYDTISMPSATEEMWRPVANDEFIVFGCALPTSYFADRSTDPYSGAEWDMARRSASILCENFEDKFAYSLTIDSNWMSRRSEAERAKLKCGYWVHYIDNQLAGGGIDIRITDVKTYLTHPLNPEITVGDEVKTISVAQQLQQVTSSVSKTYNYVQNVEQVANQQEQSNWSETDANKPSYIKNKPYAFISRGYVLDNNSNDDTNKCVQEGSYSTDGGTINLPTGCGWGLLNVFRAEHQHDITPAVGDMVMQEFVDKTSNDKYYRISLTTGKDWTDWIKLNGGGGGVTITNTLDSGTRVATINNTDIYAPNDYLQLSGGTLTTLTESNVLKLRYNGLASHPRFGMEFVDGQNSVGALQVKSSDGTLRWSGETKTTTDADMIMTLGRLNNYKYGQERIVEFDSEYSSDTFTWQNISNVDRLRVLTYNSSDTINLPTSTDEGYTNDYIGSRIEVTVCPITDAGRLQIISSPYTVVSTSAEKIWIITLVFDGTKWRNVFSVNN